MAEKSRLKMIVFRSTFPKAKDANTSLKLAKPTQGDNVIKLTIHKMESEILKKFEKTLDF